MKMTVIAVGVQGLGKEIWWTEDKKLTPSTHELRADELLMHKDFSVIDQENHPQMF